jgi:hypothetical protein
MLALLLGAAATTAAEASSVAAESMPAATTVVGAIRWDAYFSQPGEAAFSDQNFGIVTRTTTFDLSPKEWHYRVPFFGKEVNDTAIIANGNHPDVMAQELDFAQKNGIQFWAFCNYPIGCMDSHPASCPGIQCCADNVGLSYAWNLYQNHPGRHKVNFTLLLQPGYWFHGQESGSNETWPQELARYVSYFRKPNYQTVHLPGQAPRPLVFTFGHISNLTGGYVQELRAAAKAAIGVEPYVVAMNGKIFPGVDAVSAYGGGNAALPNPNGPNGSDYETTLAKPEVASWEKRAAGGLKQIPTVTAGHDHRPRTAYNMPWGSNVSACIKMRGGTPKARAVCTGWVQDPTMAQLEEHVTEGLKFVATHPASAEANMLLLSAWNEHDEGHWIAPALEQHGGDEKLVAIKKAIDQAEARRMDYWNRVGGGQDLV